MAVHGRGIYVATRSISARWLSALMVSVDKRVGNCRDAVIFAHNLAWPLKPFEC
jgi:hypothetical protein